MWLRTMSSCRSMNISSTLRKRAKDFYIWDKIIFSNTIKDRQTLQKIKRYRPLVTYDNRDELKKIRQHCPRPDLSCV